MTKYIDDDGCEMVPYHPGVMVVCGIQMPPIGEGWWVYRNEDEADKCRCPQRPDGAMLLPHEG